MNAIFQLTESSQVEAAWFCGDGTQDWMGLVYRDGPDAPWRATYRFRYYGDDPSPMADDEKSVYELTTKDSSATSRDRLVEAMALVADLVSQRTEKMSLHYLHVGGSSEDFLKLWSKQPFVHVRYIPKESGTTH